MPHLAALAFDKSSSVCARSKSRLATFGSFLRCRVAHREHSARTWRQRALATVAYINFAADLWKRHGTDSYVLLQPSHRDAAFAINPRPRSGGARKIDDESRQFRRRLSPPWLIGPNAAACRPIFLIATPPGGVICCTLVVACAVQKVCYLITRISWCSGESQLTLP